jgi:hypothetical protein
MQDVEQFIDHGASLDMEMTLRSESLLASVGNSSVKLLSHELYVDIWQLRHIRLIEHGCNKSCNVSILPTLSGGRHAYHACRLLNYKRHVWRSLSIALS